MDQAEDGKKEVGFDLQRTQVAESGGGLRS